MKITLCFQSIDKAAHSICGVSCGFIIDNPTIFNPLNSLLVYASKVQLINLINSQSN